MNFVFIVLYSNIFASYLLLYPCFTLILGIFQMIPFIWVITLQDRKTLFCVFLTFKNLRELKRTWDFLRIFFSGMRGAGALEPPEEGPEAHLSTSGATQ